MKHQDILNTYRNQAFYPILEETKFYQLKQLHAVEEVSDIPFTHLKDSNFRKTHTLIAMWGI